MKAIIQEKNSKYGRNFDIKKYKINPCPIKNCNHGVFGELFHSYGKEIQKKILSTGIGKGLKKPKTPNWNLDTWNFGDDDPTENIRLQGKLMNLKSSIINYFSMYQGLEKVNIKMNIDHTNYDVLPRKWKKMIKDNCDKRDSQCHIIDTNICRKRKRETKENKEIEENNDENKKNIEFEVGDNDVEDTNRSHESDSSLKIVV